MMENGSTANRESPQQIVCRFCLRHNPQMTPLGAIHSRQSTFLEKVYQCTQINIIDLDELHTWVCEGCSQNIEKFYCFRKMLQQNLVDFNERFRAEQKDNSSEEDWKDQQLLEVLYNDFSDWDDCYEIGQSDSEFEPVGRSWTQPNSSIVVEDESEMDSETSSL
ncbi:uncharacterized protein LOC129745744 [Uranotaenia lowii]|uniref:uncharacterized protein LOC129745744 n=1 Tax=Uranotaenia lowii TaxID=190385 RepID=UPI00247A6BB9|nr:uncharacterized protein LOC129745744 [Uranotaenia lowii]